MEVLLLIFIGLGAAAFIFFKIRKGFKKSDCGSCCGCSRNECNTRHG